MDSNLAYESQRLDTDFLFLDQCPSQNKHFDPNFNEILTIFGPLKTRGGLHLRWSYLSCQKKHIEINRT